MENQLTLLSLSELKKFQITRDLKKLFPASIENELIQIITQNYSIGQITDILISVFLKYGIGIDSFTLAAEGPLPVLYFNPKIVIINEVEIENN